MAAIDALLGLIDLQKADGLALTVGQPPALIFGSSQRVLTMPPLDPGVFQILFEEITDAELRAQLEKLGTIDFPLAVGTGHFMVLARRNGTSVSLRVRIRKEGPVRAPQPTAVAPAPALATQEVVPPSPAAVVRPSASRNSILALLRQAIDRSASDLFLCSDRAPFARVAGDLMAWEGDSLTAEDILAFFLPQGGQLLQDTGSVDIAYQASADEIQGAAPRRFRVNVFRHAGGLSAAIRPIWDVVPSLDELNLPARILAITQLTSGLVLMTGLSGSGKSTTLATVLERINQTQPKHIVTLEDPIEYLYRWQRSIVHQREVGRHVVSFASGLRAALRENPDIILVGEMRDPETIAMALTAAETGHLVLSTLHSSSAVTAIDRIVDGFPENQQQQVRAQLANVLRTLITQRLLPGRSPGTRHPVLEIVNVNYAVAAHIRDGKTHLLANTMQVGSDDGMWSLDRALVELVRQGSITAAVALETARDPAAMKLTLAGSGRT